MQNTRKLVLFTFLFEIVIPFFSNTVEKKCIDETGNYAFFQIVSPPQIWLPIDMYEAVSFWDSL